MNIWEELAALEGDIENTTLRTAWARMVKTRNPADCKLVQEIADEDGSEQAILCWKLAYRAEEYAEIEQSLIREIIRVAK